MVLVKNNPLGLLLTGPTIMEIKELAPKSKEIVIQPKTAKGVSCDAFSYTISGSGGSPEERQNGGGKKYLYIVSQIQSNDPSLDYTPNLIASFMKRELEEGNNKEELFEKALKKTNELVEGLLKENSDLKLSLGVAFINKDKVSASKIGKVKLLVNRFADQEKSRAPNEVFDIFENLTQFSKRHINNKRFSNMISGEIKNGDKFFFFTPSSRLNFKQKQIIASLTKSGQDDFLKEVHKIVSSPHSKLSSGGSPADHLTGIHFEINEELKRVAGSAPRESKETGPLQNKNKENPIVATEVAKISRNDALKRTTDKFKEMVLGGEPNPATLSSGANGRKWQLIKPRGTSNYFIAAVIVFTVVAGLVLLTRGNSKFKEAVTSINEKLRVSESRLLLKQNYEARKFLSEAFAELNVLEKNNEKEKIELAAIGLLNRLEKIDDSIKPSTLIDLAQYQNIEPNGLKNILASNGRIFVSDSVKIHALTENEAKPVEESDNATLNWLKNNKIVILAGSIKIIDLEKNKVSEFRKKFSFEPMEMKNYEDNLYFLGSKNIYKITNALLNPGQELDWLKSGEAAKTPGNFVSFALDSNIYALTDQRKLVKMFKGEITKIIDLDFDVRPGTELMNLGNKELLVVDKEMKLVRVISDEGELKVSYNLSEIETLKDAFLDKDSRILYFLSPAKIWSLKI